MIKDRKYFGTSTLDEINESLRGDEAGGMTFLGCKIGVTDNLFLFEYTGVEPPPGTFVAGGAAGPKDTKPRWNGEMFVGGDKGVYTLWRADEASESAALGTSEIAVVLKGLARLATPPPPLMRVEYVVERALSAVGRKTRYVLGGATPPLSAERWPESGAATDCSGFVSWCFRMPRKIEHPLYRKANGGWFETSAVHYDGLHDTGYFSRCEAPKPGCVLVFPDRDGAEGHMGIVVETNDRPGIEGVVKVVHCASGPSKKHGDAIAATSPKIWLQNEDSIIVHYVGSG